MEEMLFVLVVGQMEKIRKDYQGKNHQAIQFGVVSLNFLKI